MGRPHVEFIQAQALPWARGLHGDARRDVESKLLSKDPETGACSAVVRYPPGWRRDKPEHLLCDEEFFVLDGELTVNGVAYGPFSYAYLPAGFLREAATVADEGAVALTFYEGTPLAKAGRPEAATTEDRGLVAFLDTNLAPWSVATHDPKVPTGLMTKTLRIDPASGDRTWMNAMLPGGRPEGFEGPKESHPVAEELFVLAGELVGDRGIMQPGGYFWRPPGVLHGPYASRTGYLHLFRCKGGPLVNEWTEETYPLTYRPPHRPELPPEMKPYGALQWRGFTLF